MRDETLADCSLAVSHESPVGYAATAACKRARPDVDDEKHVKDKKHKKATKEKKSKKEA